MIYFLDENPELAGIYLSDKHLSCQLGSACTIICTVLSMYTDMPMPQKIINRNNALVTWANTSKSNLRWLIAYAQSVQRHFYTVYGTYHNTTIDMNNIEIPNLSEDTLSNFPLLIPDMYKVGDNAVDAYRNYYVAEKAKITDYRKETPDWFTSKLNEDQKTLFMGYFESINTNLRVYKNCNNCTIQKKVGRDWISLRDLTLEEQMIFERVLG